ncbi:MAG: hypothetical protein KKB20_05310 [Proteobacteria bacterium]|nr:hypothetical protein [Pseudomonadota bacterium]
MLAFLRMAVALEADSDLSLSLICLLLGAASLVVITAATHDLLIRRVKALRFLFGMKAKE